MKSIKEKAENYVSGFYPGIQRMCRESFEDGANYVLEEILNKTSKCITIKDTYEAFLECVERLKK